jgi:hypothetical protein
MSLGKLIGLERSIHIYKNSDNSLIEEIIIEISLEALLNVVSPKNDDSELVEGYVLNSEQIKLINAYLNKRIEPDFKLYQYVLMCFGIYERQEIEASRK